MKIIKIIFLLTALCFFTSVPFVVKAKDCSDLKKIHKKLMCKAGSDKYDETKTKKKKAESFNKKYNSLADIIKKLKGDFAWVLFPSDENQCKIKLY